MIPTWLWSMPSKKPRRTFCLAPWCERKVLSAAPLCRQHWSELPTAMRDAVARGEETAAREATAYLESRRREQRWRASMWTRW